MGKLKGKDLATFVERCTRFYKVGGTPRQIKFEHDSAADGDKTYEIITRVYSDVLFGTMSGFSRRDWTFKTNSEEERDAMFEDLQSSVNAYNDSFNGSGDPSNDSDDNKESDDDEEKKSFLSGSTVYVIMGAAAIILILLLWDTKKK